MCGSLPGVRVSAISGDTGTGTIHPPVLLRYKPEHRHQCGSAGTSVSRLWGSQIAPGCRSHLRVPKPPQGPSCRQHSLSKRTAGVARSSARCSAWPQPLLGSVLVPEPAQPAMGLRSRCCRLLTGGLGTPKVTSLCPHAAVGARNNYKLPACPSSGVLSHMMSHIWDSTSWWGW